MTTSGNYLRIRGEEASISAVFWISAELPPHTRRRAQSRCFMEFCLGTTSAYAEKSIIDYILVDTKGTTSAYAEKRACVRVCPQDHRNYLRIRGEEDELGNPSHGLVELPPHTRRRAADIYVINRENGTTSAYAEKSLSRAVWVRESGNYLRIRGEEPGQPAAASAHSELPPHTRRRAPAVL